MIKAILCIIGGLLVIHLLMVDFAITFWGEASRRIGAIIYERESEGDVPCGETREGQD